MVTVAHGAEVAVRADPLASESCFSSVFKRCPKALEDHQRTFGSEQSRHLKVDSPDRCNHPTPHNLELKRRAKPSQDSTAASQR